MWGTTLVMERHLTGRDRLRVRRVHCAFRSLQCARPFVNSAATAVFFNHIVFKSALPRSLLGILDGQFPGLSVGCRHYPCKRRHTPLRTYFIHEMDDGRFLRKSSGHDGRDA